MLRGHTLKSQVPYSASIQLHFMYGNLIFVVYFYFFEVSAYILFMFSITFGLNSTQHVGRMDAILSVFFAMVPVRKSLPYPLDITKNHNK